MKFNPMKIIIQICILLLIGNLNAQISFYIRPTVNMKTNQGNIFGSWRTSPIYSTMTNQYFSITNDKMFFDNGFDLGIQLGLKIRENHFFELGFSGDHAGIKTQASKHEWSIDPYTTDPSLQIVRRGGNHNQVSILGPFNRFSFNYNNLFWKNNSKTIQVRGVLGFGTLNSPNVNRKTGTYLTQEIPVFTIGELDSNIYNSQYVITSTRAWRNSFYLNTGLGFDFYTKKKHNYLFSFDLFYLQGTRNIQVDHHRIKINDNGTDVNFLYTFSSRGSGIYFTLSRRLQVYPWGKKKLN